MSPFSLAVLAAVSVVATIVIITDGSGHTAAQLTALAALREPRAATAQTVTTATAPAATTPTSSGAADSAPSGSGSGDSTPASDSGSGAGSDSGSASGDTGASAGTGGSGDDSTPTTSTTSTTSTTTSNLPKVSHVFEIALSTDSYAAAFADKAKAPYLHGLEAKGTVLRGYESLGHGELADELAMVSGQEPNAATSGGCSSYLEFRQGAAAKSNGLVPGNGCVYPETALTIGDQVTAKGATWKAYIADMGKATCSHPNSGAADNAVLPGAGSEYDTRHNPFIYFHSLLDLGDCASDDQDLTHLSSALAHKSATAKLSYIAPDACADSTATAAGPPAVTTPTTTPTTTTTTTTTPSPTSSTTSTATTTAPAPAPETTTTTTTTTSTTSTTGAATTAAPTPGTACPSDQPVGIAAEDAFLKLWVPRILASAAYKEDGVLVIAFAGERASHPGRPMRTGALVLSHDTKKGKVIGTAFTPYSLLRSIEDMLGDTPLAHAQSAASFAQTVLH